MSFVSFEFTASVSIPLGEHLVQTNRISFLIIVALLTAMAGGMGWGIRGQYGHETGAMVAGVLMGFTLVLFFWPQATSLSAARVVALTVLGISFGGSMTYGQTVGLTHDSPLIGNWAALRWGMLGLMIKGGVWMGFAGVLMGMGFGGKRYRPLEIAMLIPALFVALCVGIWLFNQPFDPENRLLPQLYFSDHWHWEPDSDVKPRRENWGGLLCSLIALAFYTGVIRKDRLARNMAIAGFIAGGIGFPSGQAIQALNAWNPEFFRTGVLSWLEPVLPYMNWWNMMEITFGAVAGFFLAVGLWFNRHMIQETEESDEPTEISPGWEFTLLICHVYFLVGSGFFAVATLSEYQSFGLILCAIPLIGVVGGRYWPYLCALPVAAVPIAGKTLLNLSYQSTDTAIVTGWVLYVIIPMTLSLVLALWLANLGRRGQKSLPFARIGLLFTTWLYFGLNLAFFRIPWPFTEEITGRTPSTVIFIVCSVALTLAVIFAGFRSQASEDAS